MREAFASSFARSLVDVLSSGISQLTVLDLIAVHVPRCRRRRRVSRGSPLRLLVHARRETNHWLPCRDASTVSQFGGTATRSLRDAHLLAARRAFGQRRAGPSRELLGARYPDGAGSRVARPARLLAFLSPKEPGCAGIRPAQTTGSLRLTAGSLPRQPTEVNRRPSATPPNSPSSAGP
jgi:hypothetical protein